MHLTDWCGCVPKDAPQRAIDLDIRTFAALDPAWVSPSQNTGVLKGVVISW